MLGATSHLGNNNRWSREGGLIDEILAENLYRNPEGNPLVFDTILLEKVVNEPNITLLLNTVVHDLEKSDADTIASLRAFCSQNSTAYDVHAPLFCDASGDGIVGFLSGAQIDRYANLNTTVVAEEMMRGTRSIYVDYVDYDEIAHHAGPLRPESLPALSVLVVDDDEYNVVVLKSLLPSPPLSVSFPKEPSR